MSRLSRFIALVILGIAICLPLVGCDQDDDPVAPVEDTPTPVPTPTPTPPPSIFPADYHGEYWFDGGAYGGELDFTITSEMDVSGNWSGVDGNGNTWWLTLGGRVEGGQLHIDLTGTYDIPVGGDWWRCTVTGTVDGASPDEYQSFTGNWSLQLSENCLGLRFGGTWWAERVEG